MTDNWSVQELTAEEAKALDEESQHHGLPSCQSGDEADGESDLSLRKADTDGPDIHEEEVG